MYNSTKNSSSHKYFNNQFIDLNYMPTNYDKDLCSQIDYNISDNNNYYFDKLLNLNNNDSSYFEKFKEFYMYVLTTILSSILNGNGSKIDNDTVLKNLILLESIYKSSCNFIININELPFNK